MDCLPVAKGSNFCSVGREYLPLVNGVQGVGGVRVAVAAGHVHAHHQVQLHAPAYVVQKCGILKQ